jgi:hypothetical protein
VLLTDAPIVARGLMTAAGCEHVLIVETVEPFATLYEERYGRVLVDRLGGPVER